MHGVSRGAGRSSPGGAGGAAADRLSLLRERVADGVPVVWRARWAVAPGAVLAALAVVLAVILGAGARVWWVRARADPVVLRTVGPVSEAPAGTGPPVRPAGPAGGAPTVAAAAAATPPGPPATGWVVVDVVGQVRRPGLVRLPAGSRVADAVAAAGGAARGADMMRVNLARLLVDGEQVVLPRPGEALPAPPAGGGAAGAAGVPAGPLDLNAASETDLDALPGVGPVLAGRIVAWRAQHGRFTRVEELGEVSGIGDKLLAELRPLVRV